MIAAGPAARLDALARAAVRRAAPVWLGVASTPPDLQAALRLRCLVAVGEGWIGAEGCPDGLERDGYDADAVHVVGWLDGQVVATARLVLPAADRPLPTEAAFGLPPLGGAPRVDVGRLCVAPDARGAARGVFPALVGQLWTEMLGRGFGEALSVLTDRVAEAYVRWGLEVTPLGPSRWYWGVPRWPARIAPRAEESAGPGSGRDPVTARWPEGRSTPRTG